MNVLKYYILITIFLVSCNQQIKFNQAQWQTKDDMEYPYRKKMLNDLTTNHKLSGLKYSEIIDLLGQPQISDSTTLGYQIIVDYGHDIDPVYTKYLELTFSKDSIITAFKVKEWKK